ncbi:hypothetical protein BDP27DRAFT_1340264 [Rhodocollybia butyracea]|uniref:Uncharacterized protein n=1 Tax=Rhodocollybia butyracea TaxID=206335 RepID=A0A9P5PB00_9AGAR|nr:hypothetical protein BDP27DRAFT_1340264 [Rhodocollybia butyracea]
MADIFTVPSAFFDSDAYGSTSLSTPTYSSVPNSTEISLDAEPLFRRFSWVYRTKSMNIGLGRRVWRTRSPALNGHTEHIEDISITLEGNLLVSVLGDGGAPRSNSLFLSRSITLPLSRHPLVGDEHPFAISIPSEITVQDVTALTPPLSIIAYSLKISMTRRGSRDPPLSTMPKPLLDHDLRFTSGPSLSISEHIDSFLLKPLGGLEPFKNSAIFSLPAPQSFVSGEQIPFFLSLVFPHSPAQGAMYTKNIKVSLWKQLTYPDPPHNEDDQRSNSPFECSPGHSRSNSPSIDMYGPPVTQRWHLTTGRLETRSEYSEGVHLLRGSIDAGYLGQGCSWKVGHLAQLQYFFEIEIDAPAHMKRSSSVLTRLWETMNRELQSRALFLKELNQNVYA